MEYELEAKFIREEFGKWVDEHNILRMEELKMQNIQTQHYLEANNMINTLAEVPDDYIKNLVDRHLEEEYKQLDIISSYKHGWCKYPPTKPAKVKYMKDQ
jgi:hypothetical protein